MCHKVSSDYIAQLKCNSSLYYAALPCLSKSIRDGSLGVYITFLFTILSRVMNANCMQLKDLFLLLYFA